jgi:hypothetical protein
LSDTRSNTMAGSFGSKLATASVTPAGVLVVYLAGSASSR